MIMNKKQSSVLVLVAIIAAALVVTSSMTTALVAATTTSNTTTTTSASSGIELSPQPVYQDQLRVVSQNPINETHMSITFSGNGTLTLPNTTQTINTTSNGSALISFMTLSVQGMETIRMQDSGETAAVTLYEIDRQPATSGESKGIVIAVVNTNATSGLLAPLNGMILAGIDDIQTTTGESRLTLWGWKSGIGNNAGVAPPT
jgi:archaellin